MITIKHVASTVFLSATLIAAPMVFGQGYDPSQQDRPAQPEYKAPDSQSQTITTDQLEKFVAATEEVEAVRQSYVNKLENTQDRDEASKLQQEAQEKMVEAVLAEGLGIDTYNRIAAEARNDENLQQRIDKLR